MTDILAALGLVLVLEGALYALFPEFMKRMAAQAQMIPGDTLRTVGVAAAGLGVALIWMVRG